MSRVFSLSRIGLVAMLVAAISSAHGADLYWVGANNGLWSAASSWSASSGGAGGAGVPGAGDTVIFDAGGGTNAILDSAFGEAVGNVSVTAGFAGRSITQQGGADLVVGGNFDLAADAIWRYVAGTAASPTPAQLTVNSNMTVDGTIQCQRTSTADEGTGRHFVIGGNLTIGATGTFNATDMGFARNSGPGNPGSGNLHAGGAHGGKGGALNTTIVFNNPTITYGSLTAPVGLGSGGGYNVGGGAIRFTVAGATLLNGSITANLADVSYGAGAGGSVFLTTGSISGTGTINASGGNATSSSDASGGGGRVAIVLTGMGSDFSTYDHATLISAHGGQKPGGTGASFRNGGAGTIYLQTQAQGPGNGLLVIDNNNHSNHLAYEGGTTVPDGHTWTIQSLELRNNGVLEVGPGSTLVLTTNITATANSTNNAIRLRGGQLILADGVLNVVSNWQFMVDSPSVVTGNLTIATNAVMTHTPNYSTELFKIDLTLIGNLTISNGGTIDVADKGYDINRGPGRAVVTHYGGSYGGEGEPNLDVMTYGSLTAPANIGSGGTYDRGAGAIIITVHGALTNDGVISASGSYGQYGRGAGGSVHLSAGTMAGSGAIAADGGQASSTRGGGGGRVALVVTNESADFTGIDLVEVTAGGGISGGSNPPGGAGTVYLRTAAQGPAHGTLIADNDGRAGHRTRISSLVTNAVTGDVIVRNNARLMVDAGQSLIVNGNWTNESSVEHDADGTVEFAGENSVTVTGDNTWGNLVIATQNKIVSFEAGRLQFVAGTPVFDLNVTLQSTAPDSQWQIRVPGTEGVDFQEVGRVRAQDSDASGGKTFTAKGGEDRGNNLNWVFPKKRVVIIMR